VGTDMTGKAVYTRQVLKTSDPETTPTLHRQLWTVEPDSDDAVDYAGTYRAYPVMTVEFKDYADHFEISDPNTGNRVFVDYSFEPGDVLEIDNTKGSVRINGVLSLDRVPLGAEQWIYFQKGSNPINIDPVGSAEVRGKWREVFK
ncbi:phage distal tail protein, partial [Paludifilum halophilum]